MKHRTPVDTGNLKGGFENEKIGRLKRRFFNYVEYAPDVEYGTPPHEIDPDEKKVLAFQAAAGSDISTKKLQKSKSKNTRIFVKAVHHPGTKPQPYMRPGYRAAVPKMEKVMIK